MILNIILSCDCYDKVVKPIEKYNESAVPTIEFCGTPDMPVITLLFTLLILTVVYIVQITLGMRSDSLAKAIVT